MTATPQNSSTPQQFDDLDQLLRAFATELGCEYREVLIADAEQLDASVPPILTMALGSLTAMSKFFGPERKQAELKQDDEALKRKIESLLRNYVIDRQYKKWTIRFQKPKARSEIEPANSINVSCAIEIRRPFMLELTRLKSSKKGNPKITRSGSFPSYLDALLPAGMTDFINEQPKVRYRSDFESTTIAARHELYCSDKRIGDMIAGDDKLCAILLRLDCIEAFGSEGIVWFSLPPKRALSVDAGIPLKLSALRDIHALIVRLLDLLEAENII